MIKSRRMGWAGHVTRMGETRNVRRGGVDNIKMDLIEMEWDGMDWIDLVLDRDHWRALVNTLMNHRILRNAGNFLSGCTNGSLSRSAQLRK
jgi:hypothetical protein